MRKIDIVLLLCAVQVSCMRFDRTTVAPTNASPTALNSNHWWNLWLDAPVCEAPCWQNITPGVTRFTDAVALLAKSSLIQVTHAGTHGISWRFVGAKTDSGDLAAANDGVVTYVALGNSSEGQLQLSTVIARYGDPAFVETYDCRQGMCETLLLYPDSGFFLDLFLVDKGTARNIVDVQLEDDVKSVLLFPAGLENFRGIPDYQDSLLMPWKGFVDYP